MLAAWPGPGPFRPSSDWFGPGPPGLGVDGSFTDDALAYFIERLDADLLRGALQAVLWCAKRNKAFEGTVRLGLGLGGTGVGHSRKRSCSLCHPHRNGDGEVTGWGHKMVGASVVGDALTLPLCSLPSPASMALRTHRQPLSSRIQRRQALLTPPEAPGKARFRNRWDHGIRGCSSSFLG